MDTWKLDEANEGDKESSLVESRTYKYPDMKKEDFVFSKPKNVENVKEAISVKTKPLTVVCGLNNIGNTCYMNSVIQCLAASNPIVKYTLNKKISVETSESDLSHEFFKLLRLMYSGEFLSFSPTSFRESFIREHKEFDNFNPQDSQEFLIQLLNSLHEELRDQCVNDKSILSDAFRGQLKSTLVCKSCMSVSDMVIPFWTLSLDLPIEKFMEKLTLEDCLSTFTEPEELNSDSGWICSQCGVPSAATKTLSILSPDYLIIHLKRFSYSDSGPTKLKYKVKFPLEGLDLGSYKFDLYAVVCHFGFITGGHYTSLTKNVNCGAWFKFSDSNINEDGPNDDTPADAYVLFYQRKIDEL